MQTVKKTMNYNRSVSRALDVLEQFLRDDHDIGLTELSRRLRLPKNNIFRLLATLQLRNYVSKDPVTERYQLGFMTVELAQKALRQRGLSGARTVMERLVRECNETTCVSIMSDYSVINLDSVECDHNLRVMPALGVQLPAYCTAPGKSFMAHFAEEAIAKYTTNNKFEKAHPAHHHRCGELEAPTPGDCPAGLRGGVGGVEPGGGRRRSPHARLHLARYRRGEHAGTFTAFSSRADRAGACAAVEAGGSGDLRHWRLLKLTRGAC